MSAWEVRSSCDVPPLPSKHGVAWHGFDSKHREAAFRLDTSEDATAEHHGSRVMSGRQRPPIPNADEKRWTVPTLFEVSYFQATIFNVVSSLLAFSNVGCASALLSGLANTRTMGACGRRFATHREIESGSISVIHWGRAKRSTPATSPTATTNSIRPVRRIRPILGTMPAFLTRLFPHSPSQRNSSLPNVLMLVLLN